MADKTLSSIFPNLPTVPNPKPLPTFKPHDYRERPKTKPSKSFYEIMQPDGDAVVVRSYDLLPALSQRGLSFDVARAAAQGAQKSLFEGAVSYEVGGLTIKRYEE